MDSIHLLLNVPLTEWDIIHEGKLLVCCPLCVFFVASLAPLVATYFRSCHLTTRHFLTSKSVNRDCELRGYEGDMLFEMLGSITQQCTILPPRDSNPQLQHSEHLIICSNQWYYLLNTPSLVARVERQLQDLQNLLQNQLFGTHVTCAVKWKC
jgi:hypothetical protein